MDFFIVYVTAPNEEEGAKIARVIIEEQLAACVNIVRNIRSIYRWQGRIEDETEVLLIAKTRKELFEKLKNRVKSMHSYAVPEVIAIPVQAGSEDYLRWLATETPSGD
jgi:periplasmic divalent cation tolerance protein